MDLFASPAVLGGIMICVALAAWTVGRWQGGLAPSARDRREARAAPALPALVHEAPDLRRGGQPDATPCQHAAQAERRGALEAAASLGDLHAEVSAYRRAQQVLSGMEREQLDLVLVAAGGGRECRYIGISGQPTCPIHDSARPGAVCGSGCAGFDPRQPRAVQPSPGLSDLTRV